MEDKLLALAERMGVEAKALRTLLNGNAADLTALQTVAKGNVVAAINELKGLISGLLNDEGTGDSATWSAQRIADEIEAAKAELRGGASEALDTFQEISAALANDPNIVTTLSNGLATRLRFDQTQNLTAAQKAQGAENLGLGNVARDLVADFEAALV